MLPFKRSVRVSREIQRVVTGYLQRELDRDEFRFITITDAKISDDLKYAQIFYSVYGSEQEKEKITGLLKGQTPAIRKHIGSKVRLRFTPEIMFKYDHSVEYAAKIEDLINQIHKEAGDRNEEQGNDNPDIKDGKKE